MEECRFRSAAEQCFGLLLFLLYTSEHFSILENKLIGYADDFTLMTVVPSPGIKVAAVESLSRDIIKVSECCDLWESMKEYDDLVILGVTFDS